MPGKRARQLAPHDDLEQFHSIAVARSDHLQAQIIGSAQCREEPQRQAGMVVPEPDIRVPHPPVIGPVDGNDVDLVGPVDPIDFGGLDQIKEEYRDALGLRMIDDAGRDVRLAVRSLRATPMVTAVAILSLALAIGANTAIFSILNGLMLRTLGERARAARARV